MRIEIHECSFAATRDRKRQFDLKRLHKKDSLCSLIETQQRGVTRSLDIVAELTAARCHPSHFNFKLPLNDLLRKASGLVFFLVWWVIIHGFQEV